MKVYSLICLTVYDYVQDFSLRLYETEEAAREDMYKDIRRWELEDLPELEWECTYSGKYTCSYEAHGDFNANHITWAIKEREVK